MDLATLHRLPKVELHAHLNGCIRESTLCELALERNVPLNEKYHFFTAHQPDNDVSISSSAKPTTTTTTTARSSSMPKRSLTECFEIFTEIGKCVDDLEALERITTEALQDFVSHNVAYLELRSTPKQLYRLSPKKNINNNTNTTKDTSSSSSSSSSTPLSPESEPEMASKREYCDVVLRTMKSFQKQFNNKMICKFIVAIDRAQPVECGMEHVDLALELRNDPNYTNLIVGVDLGGNPLKGDFVDFRPVFETARRHNLKVTLHCAEVPCSEKEDLSNVDDNNNNDDNSSKLKTSSSNAQERAYLDADSILEFQPDRLGHALLLPPSLQRKLLKLQIPVETCPTSNCMTLELNSDDNDNSNSDDSNGNKSKQVPSSSASSSTDSIVEGLRSHPQLSSWLFGNPIQHHNNNHNQNKKDTKDGIPVDTASLFPKHPISISTDDPGVFNTDPTKELEVIVRSFDITDLTKLKDMIMKSIDYAFCDDETKQNVRTYMERRFEEELQ